MYMSSGTVILAYGEIELQDIHCTALVMCAHFGVADLRTYNVATTYMYVYCCTVGWE